MNPATLHALMQKLAEKQALVIKLQCVYSNIYLLITKTDPGSL